jgi:hypothetical protein
MGIVAELVLSAVEPDVDTDLIARRQIPDPSTELAAIGRGHEGLFGGTIRRSTSIIDDADLIRLAMVPSNLKNLNEVVGDERRSRLVELLARAALPGLHARMDAPGSSFPLSWAHGVYQT